MVVEDYQTGTSVCELSRRYGVSRYSIQSWCGLRKEVELRHAVFPDALAVFHDLSNHPKRNTELEMDGCFFCGSHRRGHGNLFSFCRYRKAFRFTVIESRIQKECRTA